MEQEKRFNYPGLSTIILNPVVLFTIIIIGDFLYTLIVKSHFAENNLYNLNGPFNYLMIVLILCPILIQGLLLLYNIRFINHHLVLNTSQQEIKLKRLKDSITMKLNSITSVEENQLLSTITLKNGTQTLEIPKEIQDFNFLYKHLRNHCGNLFRSIPNIIKTKVGFRHLGLFLFPLGLLFFLLIVLLLPVIKSHKFYEDGALMIDCVIAFCFILFMLLIYFLLISYEITDSKIIKRTLLKTSEFYFTDVTKIRIDNSRRTIELTINKRAANSVLEPVHKNSTIKINEPRNISFEELGYELSKRINMNAEIV